MSKETCQKDCSVSSCKKKTPEIHAQRILSTLSECVLSLAPVARVGINAGASIVAPLAIGVVVGALAAWHNYGIYANKAAISGSGPLGGRDEVPDSIAPGV